VEQLAARVAREKAAYDSGDVYKESCALHARFHHVFKCPNSCRGEEYFNTAIERFAKGRDILDYGCYNGWMTSRYRTMGPSSITGLDISETAIAEAKATYGESSKFYTGDAHAMPFPEESFDLVVGRSILHHLDLPIALKEIRRVLRPSGKAIFIEPLADNPGAKVLRALTPRARTKDEKPLTRTEIQQADMLFGTSQHFFFNLVSVPVAMATSVTPLSEECMVLRAADYFDRLLAETPIKFWMRQVVLVWNKL